LASGMWCNRFSILKELCTDMMMMGCEDYKSMCIPNDTVVRECKTQTLPIPKSMELAQLIKDICSQMDMPGCGTCDGSGMLPCDVLTVYSNLCYSMPGMVHCSDWHNICSLVPSWPICMGHGTNRPPEMRMYFHLGISDYVLLQQWVPTNPIEYAFTWFAVCLITIFLDVLKFVRLKLEQKWQRDLQVKCHVVNETNETTNESAPMLEKNTVAPFRTLVDIPRSLFQFIETGWAFIIMLIAMSYNVGFFFAICTGAAIGTLIFGRYFCANGSASQSHH